MPGSEVSTEFRFGVQPSGCAESEQANQHIRCGVFFGVLEVSQGFEQVDAVVTQIGELFLEKLKKVTQPVTRCGNVEVDEIPFGAPARDRADLHTSNVSRIGYGRMVSSTAGIASPCQPASMDPVLLGNGNRYLIAARS